MAAAPAAQDSAPNGIPASIPELLAMRRAEADGEFLVTDNERLTFREADTASLELADALLASGVGKGTRVGSSFPIVPTGSSAGWRRRESARSPFRCRLSRPAENSRGCCGTPMYRFC